MITNLLCTLYGTSPLTIMTYFVDLFCVFVYILIIARVHVVRERELQNMNASCEIRLLSVLYESSKELNCFNFLISVWWI